MEDSILKTVKEILGVADDYTIFDLTIITHINGVFSILTQLGIGGDTLLYIEDESVNWADLFSDSDLNLIRSYVYLKVRMLFDPPTTSFLLDAMNKQISEFESRISTQREWNLDPNDPMAEV